MRLSERSEKAVKSSWGEDIYLPRYRYRCRQCQSSLSCWADDQLDESNCLPETLSRISEVSKLMAYKQGTKLLARFGISLSDSQMQALDQGLNEQLYQQSTRNLVDLAQKALMRRWGGGKSWVIEIDGKFVAIRSDQGIEWREVKTAVLYPMRCPSERYYVSVLGEVENFAGLVHGLLRWAGVAQEDKLIGISDGAVWIAYLLGDLGVHRHILDVYHVSMYLETLMQAFDWSESERDVERRALLRGEIDIQTWLNLYVPSEIDLDEKAHKALSYLQKQALLDHTCYPKFKQEGIEVIATGQIEGANKAVIGQRLNLSGAHWSEGGAIYMAFARANYHSYRPFADFDAIRLAAFPLAA